MSSHHTRARVAALALTLLVAALVPAGASAAAPRKESFEFSFSDFFPAGDVCDFDRGLDITISGWDEWYSDAAGTDIGVTVHFTFKIGQRNLDTGAELTDTERAIQFVDGETVRLVGLIWHLKDSTGKTVVNGAGQVVLDGGSGEVTKITPHYQETSDEVICVALGGHPA